MERADPDDCIPVIPVPEPHGPGPRTSLEIYLPSLVLGRKLPFLGTTTSFFDLRLMRLLTLGLLKCAAFDILPTPITT